MDGNYFDALKSHKRYKIKKYPVEEKLEVIG